MYNHERYSSQRGQSLVLLVIMMVAFLAILALALDGGMLFANRRRAQNAADAGALAGARELCLTDENQAIWMANRYATLYNDADDSEATVQDNLVTVTTTITYDTFFAHFIGFPELPAQATAAAGCFRPGLGDGVLPIGWICRPPIGTSYEHYDSESCREDWVTWEELQIRTDPDQEPDPGPIWKELYILMDSNSLPDDLYSVCESAGGYLDCDLDNDGDDDLVANGGRSWLDLSGDGGGSSELVTWITSGYPGTINPPIWIGGQTGVANDVFQAAADIVDHIVAIPVFDVYCDDYPDPGCVGMTDEDPDEIRGTAGGNYYYHIVSFAAFYVSCVNAPPTFGCPGHDYAASLDIIDGNTKTIEGYFVQGYIPNLGGGTGGGGIDTGAYTLYLVK